MNATRVGVIVTAIFLVSCFDVKEQIIITPDGKGVYEITLDYAATFAQAPGDSAAMLHNLENRELEEVKRLKQIPGIHNVNYRRMPGDKSFRIGFEFNSMEALNAATTDSGQPPIFQWKSGEFTHLGGFSRLTGDGSYQHDTASGSMEAAKELFQNARYELQITVPKKIKKCSNKSALKTTRNTLVFQASMADMVSDPMKNAMTIKYK